MDKSWIKWRKCHRSVFDLARGGVQGLDQSIATGILQSASRRGWSQFAVSCSSDIGQYVEMERE